MRYCHIALGSIMHCFLKMLPIFRTAFRLNWKNTFQSTFRHPQKSNPRKSIKFFGRIKSVFIVWLVFSSIQRIWYPFQRRLSFKSTFNTSDKILLNKDIWLKISKKNKKKEAKISSMYSEKKVQALRVLKKISTHNVSQDILY